MNTTFNSTTSDFMASNYGSLPNNGTVLARKMHEDEILKDSMTLEEVEKVAIENYGDCRSFKNDDYWEDFLFTAFELNYKLKI